MDMAHALKCPTPGTHPAFEDPLQDTTDLKSRKRVSVHLVQGATLPRRLSMSFKSVRSRSLSESWALSPPVSVNNDADMPDMVWVSSLSPSSSQSLLTPPSSLPSSPMLYQHQTELRDSPEPSSGGTDNTSAAQDVSLDDQQDQDLIKSLSAFLHTHNNQSSTREQSGTASLVALEPTTSLSAGLIDDDGVATSDTPADFGLVTRVRDFAYQKSHPYHLGLYPPAPVHEESDIEQDDDDDESIGWYSKGCSNDRQGETIALSSSPMQEEELMAGDRTCGQALGLYDFDAETDTELSFREGEYLWIHCRQFPGWFLGEMAGVTGLVPENYVQIL
ncbi:hypothetical protein BG004_003581 [Podila humilis]|nr:hypothetical protein BG004_003581 [Podila humilis]